MQTRFARLPLACVALAACLAVAGSSRPARALSITPDPAAFSLDLDGGPGVSLLKGSFDFLGMVTGTPAGGIVLDGSVGAGDVTLILTLAIDSDSDFGLPIVSMFRPPSASSPVFSAVGTIPGPGDDVGATFSPATGNAQFIFDDPNQVDPGETSDPFFVSFSTISVGDQLNLEYVILPLGTMTVVPEPGTLGLVVLGLAALCWRARRLRT